MLQARRRGRGGCRTILRQEDRCTSADAQGGPEDAAAPAPEVACGTQSGPIAQEPHITPGYHGGDLPGRQRRGWGPIQGASGEEPPSSQVCPNETHCASGMVRHGHRELNSSGKIVLLHAAMPLDRRLHSDDSRRDGGAGLGRPVGRGVEGSWSLLVGTTTCVVWRRSWWR